MSASAAPRSALDASPPWALALALAVNALVVAWVGIGTLRGFPLSADEYGYLDLAARFAEGRLAVPSLVPIESFPTMHFVNDGRFYAKYPPGWPAVLAVGAAVGVPWLVAPVLGLASLVVMHGWARAALGVRAAHLAMLLGLASPFFAFQSASYVSHGPCLLALLLAARALDDIRAGRGRVARLRFGLAAGAACTMRPFTALAILAVPAGVLVVRDLAARNRRALARWLVQAAPPLIAFACAFGAYDHAQTGNALLLPFQVYDPTEGLDAKILRPELAADIWHQRLASRAVSLARWTGGLPLVALAGWALWARNRARWLAASIAAPPLALVLAHGFYMSSGGFQYGPRYWYEAWPYLALAGGAALASLRGWALGVVAVVTALNASMLLGAVAFYRPQIDERAEFFREVDVPARNGCLVLVRTGVGSMPPMDMIRNDPLHPERALVALDLGHAKNAALLAAHPARSAFVYEFDAATRRGSFRPYDPREPAAVRDERRARYLRDFGREPRNLD